VIRGKNDVGSKGSHEAVGELPPSLVVFGIEAARLELGETLTPEVAHAVGRAADAVRGELLASAADR
jgi:hypothetical protein